VEKGLTEPGRSWTDATRIYPSERSGTDLAEWCQWTDTQDVVLGDERGEMQLCHFKELKNNEGVKIGARGQSGPREKKNTEPMREKVRGGL